MKTVLITKFVTVRQGSKSYPINTSKHKKFTFYYISVYKKINLAN